MKVDELFEDEGDKGIGKNDYHPENYFAPIVAEFVNDEGVAYWEDIYAYVELNTNLTGADRVLVSNRSIPRWQKNIQNLHAHRTLEGGRFGNLVRIQGGFATRKAAQDQKIPILADNSQAARNPGKRSPQYIKKKTGYIANAAYTELNSPRLRDKSATRQDIEYMIGKQPWASDEELTTKAKEIISKNIK